MGGGGCQTTGAGGGITRVDEDDVAELSVEITAAGMTPPGGASPGWNTRGGIGRGGINPVG
jgi:hypothetical protein